MRIFLLSLAALTTACAPLPEIGPLTGDANAPAPALLPVEALLAAAPETDRATGQASALSQRAANLQARARAMQGPLEDPATREALRRSPAR